MSPYISTLSLTYLSMCSLFLVFYQEIALIFMLFSFLFAIPTIAYQQMGDNEQFSMFFLSKIENQTQVSAYPWTWWEKLTFAQSFLSKHQICRLKIFV